MSQESFHYTWLNGFNLEYIALSDKKERSLTDRFFLYIYFQPFHCEENIVANKDKGFTTTEKLWPELPDDLEHFQCEHFQKSPMWQLPKGRSALCSLTNAVELHHKSWTPVFVWKVCLLVLLSYAWDRRQSLYRTRRRHKVTKAKRK